MLIVFGFTQECFAFQHLDLQWVSNVWLQDLLFWLPESVLEVHCRCHIQISKIYPSPKSTYCAISQSPKNYNCILMLAKYFHCQIWRGCQILHPTNLVSSHILNKKLEVEPERAPSTTLGYQPREHHRMCRRGH